MGSVLNFPKKLRGLQLFCAPQREPHKLRLHLKHVVVELTYSSMNVLMCSNAGSCWWIVIFRLAYYLQEVSSKNSHRTVIFEIKPERRTTDVPFQHMICWYAHICMCSMSTTPNLINFKGIGKADAISMNGMRNTFKSSAVTCLLSDSCFCWLCHTQPCCSYFHRSCAKNT